MSEKATELAAHGAEIAHLERLRRLATEEIADLRQQVAELKAELKAACHGKDKEIGRLLARRVEDAARLVIIGNTLDEMERILRNIARSSPAMQRAFTEFADSLNRLAQSL